MTQVVSEPAYSDIMRHLMLNTPDDPEGMELYLRNPASFNIPTGEAAVTTGAAMTYGMHNS
jgi:hypothetical protein